MSKKSFCSTESLNSGSDQLINRLIIVSAKANEIQEPVLDDRFRCALAGYYLACIYPINLESVEKLLIAAHFFLPDSIPLYSIFLKFCSQFVNTISLTLLSNSRKSLTTLEGCLTLVTIDMTGKNFAVDVIVCQRVMTVYV